MNDRALPADETVAAWVAGQHHALVRDLATTLDLEAGIREATIPARHTALAADVNGVLDVEGGLSEITSGQLPTELPYDALLGAARDAGAGRIPIGLTETDLQPAYLDAATEPHFLVFGDADSGKSGFLRTVARGIVRMYEPGQARVILVDYRRSLLGCIESPHLIGYGASAKVTADLIEQAAAVMRERLPGPGVTAEQLRNRSWWRGPELFVLVDDYDLVAATGTNPLAPLLDYLPQSRDVGLHVVVTRRAGGASRALVDPILRRLRELGSPGIVLSGPREEGPLLGNVKPDHLPPGRGWLVTRRTGTEPVRLDWTPPAT
jgi:DNA segregation ATPase FtsK/SpoIIIE, S-DNA-T family